MLDNLTKKQKIIVIAIAGIVVIGIMYFIYNKNQAKEDINIENEILVNNVITNENNTNDDIVIIHITGSVKNPGIVKLKEGSRIEDAIESAGGLTENADITKVNLAYVVEDGTKIKIPSASEEDIGDEDIIDSKSGDNIIIEENAVPSNNSTQTININKATEKEFETLPGIGPSLASKIIEYRNQNGKFESIEDIKNVNGIGDNKYEKIKDLINSFKI